MLLICKDINGNECTPLHIWVAQYGSAEDQMVHDNPDSTTDKIELIKRYYVQNSVRYLEEYQDGVLIKTDEICEDGNLKIKQSMTEVPVEHESNEFKYVYKTKDGENCKGFYEWVLEFGTEEELKVHNSENFDQKSELLLKYMKAVGAVKYDLYFNNVLIEEFELFDESGQML